jgi:hypothetical protein
MALTDANCKKAWESFPRISQDFDLDRKAHRCNGLPFPSAGNSFPNVQSSQFPKPPLGVGNGNWEWMGKTSAGSCGTDQQEAQVTRGLQEAGCGRACLLPSARWNGFRDWQPKETRETARAQGVIMANNLLEPFTLILTGISLESVYPSGRHPIPRNEQQHRPEPQQGHE